MNIFLIVLLFIASFIASLFGIGGGALYTPFQLWMDIPFQQAVPTSLLLVLVTSLSSTIIYRQSKRVDWILAIMLEIPTTIGAFIGGVISHRFSSHILAFLLILTLIVSAWFMIRPLNLRNSFCAFINKDNLPIWYWKRNWGGEIHSLDLRCVLPIMFVVGALISAVGISGGVIKIPLMVLLFKVPMSIAIGSSAFMVGLTATAGLFGHIVEGPIEWKFAVLLLIPVFIGAQLGSRLSVHTKTEKLKKLYGWFLLIVAIITFLRVWKII